MRDAATELSEDDPDLGCYVAVERAAPRLLGAIVFTIDQPTKRALIRSVGVVKPWRRQRIATELKQRAIDYLGKRQIEEVVSTVNRFNYPMQRVNEQMFSMQGVIEELDGDFVYTAEVTIDPAEGPAQGGPQV